MKILYLLDNPPWDAERFVLREIEESTRQGIRARVAFPWKGTYRIEEAGRFLEAGRGEERRPGEPLPPVSFPSAILRSGLILPGPARRARRHCRGAGRGLGSGLRQALSLAGEAVRFQAGALHAHFAARACEDAMLASWIARVPFTFTAHGYDIHSQPPADLQERAVAAAAVVTVSQWNARVLREKLGVPEEKIRVIPPGVDTDLFAPGGEEETGLVTSVMRLHPDKGPDILLEAAARLLERRVEFRLEVLGDGPMRGELEDRLHGPLAERVRLAGRAGEDQVLATLRRTAVYVQPSRTESLGVALMEAMACARPVVATRAGGAPEVVGGEESGLLVPPEDPRALAGAIERLLEDGERRRAMGAAGRSRIQDRFPLRGGVEALRDLWRAAAAGAA